jgi:signal peptidase I
MTLIAGSIGVAFGRAYLGRVAIISGTSMAPTLRPGAWVYTAAISGPLERGDVVLLNDGYSEPAVKRIVGMPGEKVCLHRGHVFINGRILVEPYITRGVYTFPKRRLSVFVLGPEEYFVLGDNRPASSDSRSYGPIARNQVERRIPLADAALRAHFGRYSLPIYPEFAFEQTTSKAGQLQPTF